MEEAKKNVGVKIFLASLRFFVHASHGKTRDLTFFGFCFFCFLFLFWIWIWIWIFYFSYVFNLDLFPVILFALSKQKRLALGNKNLAYRVILCIGTKEVIL
jgi:hypothetical protein